MSHRLTLSSLFLMAALAAHTHELGKVQVYATFHKDGTYTSEVPVDPEHLNPEDGPMEQFLRAFADRSTVAFDGQPVKPKVEIEPPDPSGRPGRTLRLSGSIPGGARTFTWKNEMSLGSYPLILQNEGDESAEWKWLEGGAASPPFALAKN